MNNQHDPNEHNHSNPNTPNSCCGGEALQGGIHQAIHRINERNATKAPSLYSNQGKYKDILADYLKKRQNRLSLINNTTGGSWAVIESVFEKLITKGYQIARYMDVYESDLAENLNLISKSKEKAIVLYGTISILDDQNRLNLMLYLPEQPQSSYGRSCNGISSVELPELFKEVLEILTNNGLSAEIGDYPGIIAVKGDWAKIDYSEIDNYDLDFHLEMRVGLENLSST